MLATERMSKKYISMNRLLTTILIIK